jgi:7-cyano-7-deazaguanine synthase
MSSSSRNTEESSSGSGSVVLLSGGLDSVVNAAIAARKNRPVLCLTFNYGQKAARQEVQAAEDVSQELGAEHLVVRLPWLSHITKTALVNAKIQVPRPAPEALRGQEAEASAKAVWVPNRNGVFVNIAAAFAEARGLANVVAGFNAEEGTTFPDNSPEFTEAANRALALSTLSEVRLVSYTAALDKAGIVSLGMQVGAPLHFSWSCYLGGERLCWACESCSRLRAGLEKAGYWQEFRNKCPHC